MENMKELIISAVYILNNPEILQDIFEFQKELNLEIDKAVLSQKELACKKGCSYCCYEWDVRLNITELLYLLSYLNNLPPEKRLSINERLQKFKKISDYRGIPCPFLENNFCVVYEARPYICRTFSSYDVSLCERKEKFEFPSFIEEITRNIKVPYESQITEEFKPLFETKTTISNINFDEKDVLFYIDLVDVVRIYSKNNKIFVEPLILAKKYLNI